MRRLLPGVALALVAFAFATPVGRDQVTWSESTRPAERVATTADAFARVLPEAAPAPPAPPCQAHDIVPTFIGVSVAPGSKWIDFALLNAGEGPCQLAGDPVVAARRGSDPAVLASRGVVVGGFPDAGPAATLGSGDAAGLSVIVAGECQNDNWLRSGRVLVPASLDLTLPGGVLGLAVPDDVGHQFRPDGLCPFMVSGFEHWLK
jgi:hypothetical protein